MQHIASLETSDLASLTTSQILAITPRNIGLLRTQEIIALRTDQVLALRANQLKVLTSTQLSSFEVDDIQALSTSQVLNFSGQQINFLSTLQVSSLLTTQLAALTPSQISTLNTVNLNSLTTTQFQALTALQIAGMSTLQVSNLETADLLSLSSTQLRAISVKGIGALRAEEITSLTTQWISSLSNSQIPGLSSTNLNLLSTSQLKSLTTSQIVNLNTKQIASMGTDALASLTSSQVRALTAGQIRALGAKVSIAGSATPVVLDLNGDGIRTLSIDAGVQFDILANGLATQTGWISSGDGLLVMDRNGDQIINDGSELFGSATTLSDGLASPDGFTALRELDSNHDGLINQSDISFKDLKVWIDSNSNGLSSLSEIKTLNELAIRQLNLNAATSDARDNGNLLGLTSSFETTDGRKHDLADVWFAIERPTILQKTTTATHVNVVTSELSLQVGQLTQAITVFANTEYLSHDKSSQISALDNSTTSPSNAMLPVSLMVAELQRVAKMEFFEQPDLLLASPVTEKHAKQLTLFDSIETAVKSPEIGNHLRGK